MNQFSKRHTSRIVIIYTTTTEEDRMEEMERGEGSAPLPPSVSVSVKAKFVRFAKQAVRI